MRLIRWARGVLRQARPIVDGMVVVGRLIPSVNRWLGVQLLVGALLVAVTPVAVGVVSAVLVTEIPLSVLDNAGAAVPSSTLVLLVVLGVLLMVMELARQWLSLVSRTLGREVDGDLRRRALAAALAPVGIAHLEDPELRDVFGAARNLSPFSFTPGDAVQQLGWAVALRVQSLLALVVVAWYSPPVALGLLVWCLTQVLALVMVVRITSSAIGMLGDDALYLRDLVLTPGAAKEVRVFGLGRWLSGRFTSMTRERLAAAIAGRRGQTRWYLAAAATAGVGLFAGLAWAAVEGTNETMTLTAVAVSAAAVAGVFTVPNVILDIPIAYGMFAVPAIAEAEARSATALEMRVDQSAPDPLLQEGIALEDVTFSYPRTAEPVLRELELAIPAGQRLAVVGLNGSGKTTLVKLLCRLYDPDHGTIRVDGTDLRDLDPVAWRERLAVLFQDFIRYEIGARDNIALGVGPEEHRRLASAADAAGASPFVTALADGWETPLSSSRSGGVELSGGQWQRIALARALFAVDLGARLLVLDEPTANLDPRGEQQFFDSVLNSPRLRDAAGLDAPITTILISHRFATVRHADRIVVLADGRIVEDGTHAELLDARGRYRALFEAQAAAYRDEVGDDERA